MLRNEHHTVPVGYEHCLLNEVLSLNAQECRRHGTSTTRHGPLLNEVLSLNAQESVGTIEDDTRTIPQ